MVITQFYKKLIPEKLRHDILIYSNAKAMINVIFTSLVAIPIYAYVYYAFNYQQGAYLLLVLGIFFLFSLGMIKTGKSLFLSGEIFISSLFLCLAGIAYYTGGINSSSIVWLVLPPTLAVVFGNIKAGVFWLFIVISYFLLLFIAGYLNILLPDSPITNEPLLRFYSRCGLAMVLFLLVYFYYLSQKESMLKLEIAKQESDYLMEKSQEAVRAKNEFLENMSHELRTPLNTIIGYTELLLDNEMSSEQNNEFTQIILSSSKKLTGMVDDLLTMSRIEFGEIRFYPTLINLPKLIADVKLPFYDSVAEKKLNIKIMVDPDLKLIKTDPSKLRQMLSCYLSNAIKFSHPEGKIEIRAFSIKNDEFRIEVEDQGIGVNKENLDKLFVLFSQQDMSKSKKYQGMGLGLALTRRIAEAQGGKVGVQSELNKGSIFYIILLNSAPQKINHQKANHSAEFSIES